MTYPNRTRPQGAPYERRVTLTFGCISADYVESHHFDSVEEAAAAIGVSGAAVHQAYRRRGRVLGALVSKGPRRKRYE